MAVSISRPPTATPRPTTAGSRDDSVDALISSYDDKIDALIASYVPTITPCEMCAGAKHAATHRCVQCGEHLCAMQVLAHRSSKKTNGHVLLNAGPLSKIQFATPGVYHPAPSQPKPAPPVHTSAPGTIPCPDHGRTFELFDDTDQSLACMLCVSSRRGHNFIPLPVPAAVSAFRAALPSVVRAGEMWCGQVNSAVDDVRSWGIRRVTHCWLQVVIALFMACRVFFL